jgi:4-hydroxy-tetrahydrodipicolinate synthase
MMGAVGWFAGYPNAFPREAVAIYDLVVAGRFVEARELYENLVTVFRWDSRTEFVQAIKLSIDMAGYSYGGPTRPPRGPLSAAHEARVRADTNKALNYLAQRKTALV